MRRLLAFFCLLVVLGSCVWAGPFGIEMGWTLEDLDKNGIKYEKYGQSYNISTYDVFPEREHPDFEEYFVKIDTEEGIYQISAVGKEISTSSYGTALKSAYEKVRDQISLSYRQPEEFDFLNYGSIWDEPDDWMMALKLEERTLASYWRSDKDNIDIIALKAFAFSSSEGFLSLSYQTTHVILDDILARHDASASSVF